MTGPPVHSILFLIKYHGDEDLDWSDPGMFPQQVGTLVGGNVTTSQGRGELGIPTAVGYYFGNRPGGGGDVRPPSPEHHIPIYRESSDIGAVSGGR